MLLTATTLASSSPQRIDDGGLITKNRNRMAVDIDRVAFAGSPTRDTYSSDSIARAGTRSNSCAMAAAALCEPTTSTVEMKRPSDLCFASHLPP